MRRTFAGLSPEGNPFRQLEANARILMPRRDEVLQRRWVASREEGQDLGRLDVGTLACYGMIATGHSTHMREQITVPLERWIFPEPQHVDPAQIGSVDIARYRPGREHEHRTTAVILSPPLDDRDGYRAGFHIQVDSNRGNPYDAKVQLVTTNDSQDSFMPSMYVNDYHEYGEVEQRAMDGFRLPELYSRLLTASHAVIPLVVDCNRVLAELAAGTEAASWTRVPIGQTPVQL
jgi:hypothetical protein